MIRTSLGISIALAATLLTAQDPVSVSPEAYRIEIENNRVRTLRLKLSPGQKTAMHQHPASVIVYLTDSNQRITDTAGKSREIAKKAGEVEYIEAVSEAEENISGAPLEAVVVELKPGVANSKASPITLDPVKLDPQHHTVPFENERVRVLRTVLEPHIKSPMHQHPAYVVVYLTELHTAMTLGDGRTVDNPRQPGEVAWREAYRHITENVGSQTAVEIQIELK